MIQTFLVLPPVLLFSIFADDYEIDSLCKHLGAHKSQIIGPPEIISICNSMGITNSVYEVSILSLA